MSGRGTRDLGDKPRLGWPCVPAVPLGSTWHERRRGDAAVAGKWPGPPSSHPRAEGTCGLLVWRLRALGRGLVALPGSADVSLLPRSRSARAVLPEKLFGFIASKLEMQSVAWRIGLG